MTFKSGRNFTRTCKICKQIKPMKGGYNHPRKFKCADCLSKETRNEQAKWLLRKV
jgi:hypothetical protein